MPTLDDDTLLIPFGTSKWSDRRLKVEDDGSFQCMAPHVLVGISERQPLRLNSAQYEFMEPPNHRELADPADQLEFVLNHMKIHCDLWGKFQKLFLDRYVQFIAAHVEENKAQLSELIKPFGSLYQYRDWMFSAYRPLPQAHFNVGGAAYVPDDLIAADFAFWGTDGGIALYLISSPHRNSARQKRYDRLEAAGIKVVEIEQTCLQPDQQAVFEEQLPDTFRTFWKEEPFPSSPFKSNVLDANIISP
ncbi:MAG: hypothetical protein HOB79_05715 [Rhodospirillaceae bacterium]|nr:hypothetical protein [Rhodospirillaceae bacterium]